MDAEVGGKIDNLDSALMELSQHVHGLAVGDGEEDHVAKLFSPVGIVDADHDVRAGKFLEEGIKVTEAFSGLRAGAGHGQFHVRMAGEKAGQFHACVTGNADEADSEFFHCLFLRYF